MSSSKKKNYSKTSNNVEFYETDTEGNEVYLSQNNMQFYAFNYPNKEEIYAVSNGQPYYATYNKKEIYAIDLKSEGEKFININGSDKYTQNELHLEFYPRDLVGKNKVAKNKTNYFYAKDENAQEFYPLDEFGNEYIVEDLMITCLGEIIAPKKRDGSVSYFKKDGIEIPFKCNNIYFVAKNAIGEGQYPKDSFGNSYYPDDNIDPKFATDKRKQYIYALNNNNNTIIYPNFSNEEKYIQSETGSYHILKKYASQFTHYASNEYPIKYLKNGLVVEMLINDIYSEKNNKKFYPKDSNKNEYVNSRGDLLDSYPKTHDGNVILPNYNNKPLVKPTDNDLLKQIKCLLYRPDFKRYDFLLTCSPNNPFILHADSFKKIFVNLRYVSALLCTIVCILLFILLVIKK